MFNQLNETSVGSLWLGLYKLADEQNINNNTWKWEDRCESEQFNWDVSLDQPNNFGGNENCALFYNGNKSIHDVECYTFEINCQCEYPDDYEIDCDTI